MQDTCHLTPILGVSTLWILGHILLSTSGGDDFTSSVAAALRGEDGVAILNLKPPLDLHRSSSSFPRPRRGCTKLFVAVSSVKFAAAVFLSRNRSQTERNFTPETERRTDGRGSGGGGVATRRKFASLSQINSRLAGRRRRGGRKNTLLP